MSTYTVAIKLRSIFRLEPSAQEKAIEVMLGALAWIDLEYLKRFPNTPSLYKSGVRYKEDEFGVDEWLDIPEVLLRGFGDCDDLVPWRIAELWNQGINAKPLVTMYTNGQNTIFHAQVAIGTRAEDPSAILGMNRI